MAIPVYKLQIVHHENGAVATFNGRGMVEHDLMDSVKMAIAARVPEILAAMQAKGRWWIIPQHFDAALADVLFAAIPQLSAEAVDAVILAVKQDATAKM